MRRNNKNNVLECAKKFDIKTRLLFKLFFSNTINANLNDISTYNYSDAVEKTIELIEKNEIKNVMK
jgi:hypothetical protein